MEKFKAPAIVVVAVLAGIAGWLIRDQTTGKTSAVVPNEYLYLDAARVNAYLGQLGDGLSPSFKQNLTRTRSASATIPVGGAALGAAETATEAIEQTVTPDEGDRLYSLLRQLKGPLKDHFRDINVDLPSASDALEAAPEGEFIELDNARLSSPRFALPVPALAQGYQRFLTNETPVSSGALSSLTANHPAAVQRYLQGFGSNPTIPLRVVVAGNGDGVDRILVPTLLRGLLNSSNLINGNVSLLGLVVRQIQQPPARRSPYDVQDKSYYDAGSAVAIKRALVSENVPAVVARVLKLPKTESGLNRLIADRERHTVQTDRAAVQLTRTEFELLSCMATSPQRTFTFEELCRQVWGTEEIAHSSRTLDSHVSRLRTKLEQAGAAGQLQRVRGVGMMITE